MAVHEGDKDMQIRVVWSRFLQRQFDKQEELLGI